MTDGPKMCGFKETIKRTPILGVIASRVHNWLKPSWMRESSVQKCRAQFGPSYAIPCYMGNGVVLARVNGMKMFLPSDDCSITPHLVMDGNWEPWVSHVFRASIKPGMTVVDVGANVGYFTLLAAWCVGQTGKVYAFEPEPKNFDFMSRNVAVNGLSWVTLSKQALWNKAGTAELHTTGGCGGHSLVGSCNPLNVGMVMVETIPLDSYLPAGQRVDVIKIDAEGAEPWILEGMQGVIKANPHVKILVEFAPAFIKAAGRDPMQFLEWIKGQDFQIKLIRPDATVTSNVAWAKITQDNTWMEMLLLERT